eukprot:3158906-Prymnesium_polylepis.1
MMMTSSMRPDVTQPSTHKKRPRGAAPKGQNGLRMLWDGYGWIEEPNADHVSTVVAGEGEGEASRGG